MSRCETGRGTRVERQEPEERIGAGSSFSTGVVAGLRTEPRGAGLGDPRTTCWSEKTAGPSFFGASSWRARRRKVRADFRKNRTVRAQQRHSRSQLNDENAAANDAPQGERISGKGELARRRTVAGENRRGRLGHGRAARRRRRRCAGSGRVLRVQGLVSVVRDEDGTSVPVRDAAAAEDAQHRSAARGGGGRLGLVPPRRQQTRG